jgi:Fur family transcriptional regulator, ferric uptake regulator
MSSTGLTTRLTPHQKQMLKALELLDGAISAQDLHIKLCSNYKPLGLATVYRGLEVLKLHGLVQSRISIKGESLYSTVQKHQHYVTCLRCHESINVDVCPICQLEAELEQKLSFKVFFHTLEFFGLCVFCQATDA